ncbi:MAG: TonB-dependent receptor, partial [Chitinophagaceae bacterium]
MRRNILLYLAAFLISTGAAFAQTGKMQGKITDAATGEEIPFATVIVKMKGAQKGGGAADFSGIYIISPLTPGSYDVEVSSVGYNTKLITGVTVMVDETRFLNVALETQATVTGTVDVVAYKEPIIAPGRGSVTTFTKENIQKMSTRETTSIAQLSAAVFAADDRAAVNIKGARSAGTTYYLNGVKMFGTPNLPVSSIEQMSVLTGGTPAQYGDAVGGIINITTQGPSSEFFGGIALETSAPFDKYDNNLAEFSISGPILTRKADSTAANIGDRSTSLLGFFLSGNYSNSQDLSPSAAEVWYLNPEKEAQLGSDPFFVDENGQVQLHSESITKNDLTLEKNGRRRNVRDNSYLLNGSLDLQLNRNSTFTLGGTFERRARNAYSLNNSLINPQGNQHVTNTNYNAYVRFTQRFAGNEEDSSGIVLKNAYFQIQADYSKQLQEVGDKDLKDDFFKYGRIGTFGFEGRNYQGSQVDSVTIINGNDTTFLPTIYA